MVSSAAQVLGNAIGHLVNVLDPEIVVIGGGLGMASGMFRDTLMETARHTIWSDVSRRVPIRTSELGTLAGVVGAALASGRHAGTPSPSRPREGVLQ